MNPAPPRALVLTLFFLSGLTGLIYEVLWTRMFTLVLGTMVHAVSTVLAVYMGGMALGSWWFGRQVGRPGVHGLRVYGILEVGVAVAALLVPFLMGLAEGLYRSAWAALGGQGAGLLAVRVGTSALVLLVPTVLMGGTLPALSQLLVHSRGRSGREVGVLYAINTLGAVIGCGLAGFVLLERLGTRATLWSAAGLSLLIGCTALAAARGPVPVMDAAPVRGAGAAPPSLPQDKARHALLAVALSGALALALEVLWTRSLMYFVSVDTWAFAAMLCAFLLGLGLGSLLAAPLAQRSREPLRALGLLQGGVAVGAAASVPLLDHLLAIAQAAAVDLAGSLPEQAFERLLLSGVVMLLPCLCMGAAMPFAAQVYVGAGGCAGRATGVLYALNTAGAILGSLAAGFVVIPALGIQRGILVLAALYALLAVILLRAAGAQEAGIPLAWPALLLVLAIGAGAWYPPVPMILRSHWFRANQDGYRLLGHWETADATVAVLEKRSGMRELNINGFSTACDNYMDMQVHRMLSHLAMLAHPSPARALVVGFGMGATTFGCCQHDTARVDVVELLAVERQTAPFFHHVNHGVLDSQRLRFVHADGRNHLLLTDQTYDVITFNAIHPRYSANLYTVDFYRLCLERLSPDGVICAWVTQNGLRPGEWRMLCKSLTEVFPESSLWYCNPQHFCLLGSRAPLRVAAPRWAARMAQAAVAADLADSNLHDPHVLLARYLLGGPALTKYLADAPLNTDDRPLIEFTRQGAARDEREVIVDLIARKESVASVLAADTSPAFRERLAAAERSTVAMMQGQTEFWYPTAPLRSEIAFRQALLLCPDNQDVRHNLGFSDLQRRRIAADRQLRPDDPLVLTALARTELEAGCFAAAESLLRAALNARADLAQAAELLARARLQLGKADQAVVLFSQLLELRPNDALAHQGLGQSLLAQGRAADAQARFLRAKERDPLAAELFELRQRTPRAVLAAGGR